MTFIEYALFGITALSSIFAVYRTFRDPDEKAVTDIAVLTVKYGALDDRLTKFLTNDWPHADASLKDIHGDISDMKQSIVKLATIIEERIPRRQ